ncbi:MULTISPECIES: CASTOR/POLLUX-related putative ion channel [Streptomyces]|uniref:CASTOR/POLLUX-related putative ion channel n=1 Tax=Streptomyces TaxID=1883 RepID=UPI00163C6E3A|nr:MULTISPECIES: NAD-binding lipoprotein [Streptomyces]MBC2878668.1 NAD-binding lipoprotein [Streptomyces sp. TYQ1024]UBI35114.1 NAD-binding lipoprotein [Streptomyces mobaraensis]UKW27708.1 NAD-binding lipoprotein [Streptomyces sp. TYQ1024]
MARRRLRWVKRAGYWFDNTLARGASALIGWLVLACLAVVVPVSALMVWTARDAPASLPGKLAQVWHRTGDTLRLGGLVGPPAEVLLSVILALVALIYVSALVGLITAGVNERMAALRRGRSTVLEDGHVVVLGWSEQVFTVVTELVAANANQRRAAVAVLADRDKTAMEDALHIKVGTTGGTRLICRSGSTTDPAVLPRVSPHTAGAVLVLPRDGPSGDAEVVKTLLALRAATRAAYGPDDAGTDTPPGVEGGGGGGGGMANGAGAWVVAAVRDARYRLAASLAAGDGGVVLETDDITARLIVQSARRPGLSLVYQELLDFAGDEFYTVREPALAGRTFGEALLAYATSSAVGLIRTDGSLLLNPPAETVIGAADRIVVVTRDDDTAVLAERPPAVDEAAIVTDVPPERRRPERVLLLGWNRRAPLIVGRLRRYTAPGSVVDVVAEAAPATAAAVRAADGEAGGALSVVLRPGDPADRETVDAVDAASYDSVIVLGPDPVPGPGGATEEPDDRTLVTLLLLRALEAASGRELPVVTEMTDDRNRALAPVSPGADFIVSGKLIGLLMAQISQNRHLAAVFQELFSAGGSEILLRPASRYVRACATASFATVVEAARRHGECAIGYRDHAGAAHGPRYGVWINPHKETSRRWADRDEVVVVAAVRLGGPENAGEGGGQLRGVGS